MHYAVIDRVSGFYLAVAPTPRIKFLLREAVSNASEFESRALALAALDAAANYFAGVYSDYELEVRPLTTRRKEHLARTQLPKRLNKYAGDFIQRVLSGSDAEDS